ncbi:NCS2 family permease [Companilactobacillus metriopterae]|uniref:NCS2 family permease n=1 Tax=Companilactobacillus metriopterae TaxID=1909267 RepID=UPI00100B734A|nr:NCS2 family permease [Companilactobacillus metriopterae]
MDNIWNNKLSGKDLKNEIIAGVTGFFAISYIMIVNPIILGDAAIPANLSVFATIFSSALGCILMSLWANSPIIITPGMGVNAFFTYTLVIGMHLSWQQAISISIVSSVLYMIVAFSKISDVLSRDIPDTLKNGITVGIGLFLVVVGLEKAGLIQSGGKQSLLMLGNMSQPTVLLSIFGLVVTLILFLNNVTGSFIIGIVLTSILSLFLNISSPIASTSVGDLGSMTKILFQGDFSDLFSFKFLLAVFSMTMILVFESMGILEGLLPDNTKFKKSFQASSVSTFISGFLGTSPTVAAAESASGIESGGRTGIMSLTSGILFLLSIFFIPLLKYVPEQAIAPVIIITGALMMQQLQNINYQDLSEWIPAFLILVIIPLSGSISAGMAFGFVSYPFLKFITGKKEQVNYVIVVVGCLFLLQLICDALLV